MWHFSEVQTCNEYAQKFTADFKRTCISCQVNTACQHITNKFTIRPQQVISTVYCQAEPQGWKRLSQIQLSCSFQCQCLIPYKNRNPVQPFSLRKPSSHRSFCLSATLIPSYGQVATKSDITMTERSQC